MEGTRLRILQLLQRNNCDTVDGLAKSIGLAPATIRRHLDILQRDRLISFEEVRKKTGRPEYSFFLTEEGQEALPKDYADLLGLMVEEVATLSRDDTSGKDGAEVLELVFRRLSDRAAESYGPQTAGRDLVSRVGTLRRHLTQKDFFPETEVEDGKLRIRLLNCPFRSVALKNRSVCTFDLNLISSVLDTEVEREECICKGDSGCSYTANITQQQQRELQEAAR